MNNVTFVGRIANEPTTNDKGSVMNLRLAVNDRRYNSDTKKWDEDPQFFNLVIFGKRAESLDFLKKGMLVSVECRAQNNNYEKDGVMHYAVEFVVNDIQVLSKKED